MDKMSRLFHVTLTDRQYALLWDEADRADVSMAELLRRAIDATYRSNARRRLRGYEVSLTLTREPDAAAAGRRVEARVPGRPLYAREM